MLSNNSSIASWQQCGFVAGLVLPLMAVACGTQSTEHESSSSSALVDASKQVTPSVQAALKAPQAARVLVRASATGYEVEVQSPSGFSPQAFDPVLRVGEKEFSNAHESKLVGEYGAVFRIDKSDFETLAEASDISVGFGRGFARPVALGRLDKQSLAVR